MGHAGCQISFVFDAASVAKCFVLFSSVYLFLFGLFINTKDVIEVGLAIGHLGGAGHSVVIGRCLALDVLVQIIY